jgi:hypothetical protein
MMHHFDWPIILFLSFHLIGGFFVLASILGIPGQLEETRSSVKRLSHILEIRITCPLVSRPFSKV